MSAPAVDLVGPKGYTHGWVYHGPGRGTRTHTGRLVSADVRTQQGRLRNASPALAADRATAALRGKRASDYQHLAAARLHMRAARSASSPELKARHTQLAKMHRGIATRTPGRGTRSEGPLRSAGGSGGRSKGGKMAAHPTGKASESTAGRRSLAKLGLALPDGSFPVGDAAHWDKARQAIGRVKNQAKRQQVAALLRRTAARYGKTQALRESWAAPRKAAVAAANSGPAVELTGPKGWVHGWLRPGGSKSPPKPASAPPKFDPARYSGDLSDLDIGELRHLVQSGHPLAAQAQKKIRKAGFKAPEIGKPTQWRVIGSSAGPSPFMHQGRPPARVPGEIGRASARGHANTGPALEFAMDRPRLAVASPYDVMVTRGADGTAVLRHRRGGYEIARLRRDPDGSWVSSIEGRDLQPHVRQRAALLEAIGVHNAGSSTPYHRAEVVRGEELQPKPVQTQLMERLGIEPARMSLANSAPVVGASDGPRASSQPPGLGAKGQGIYKKLRGRGFPHARAHAFAKRAERFGARRSGK